MRLTRARNYLSRFYHHKPKKIAKDDPQLKEEWCEPSSQASISDVPCATRRMRSVSAPGRVDLDVADWLLARRSAAQLRGNPQSNTINGKKLKSNGLGLTFEVPSKDIAHPTPGPIAATSECELEYEHSSNSIYLTPKPAGAAALTPAKRLRHSPSANAALAKFELADGTNSRNTSNQSAISDRSNTTVHHEPEKRCRSPITALDTIVLEASANPFSDRRAMSSSDASNSTPTQAETSRGYSRGGDCPGAYRDPRHQSIPHGLPTRSSESTGFCLTSRRSSNSSDYASRRILDGTHVARREYLRSRATLAFNASAAYFGLDSLRLAPTNDNPPTSGSLDSNPPGSFAHRLRTAKSTLSINDKGVVKRTLRRIKTMAQLPSMHRPGALKGKSLEEIARLGGESLLNMPPDYGPEALKLPTCIAVTVNYLLSEGVWVPRPGADSCDEKVVHIVYSRYAEQVFIAEKVKERISKTTRPLGNSFDLRNIGRENERGPLFARDVSTVLQHYLSDLPGGILGSARLYQTLKAIHGHKFTLKDGIGDPGRRDYLSSLAAPWAARIRMITLALLALTTDMQLELICAIFGLLSLTADECALVSTGHRYEALRNPAALGQVFGPLLSDTRGATAARSMQNHVLADRGAKSADIAVMLIVEWKRIFRQLRLWGILDTSVGELEFCHH